MPDTNPDDIAFHPGVGLTKREYFASQAMIGFLAAGDSINSSGKLAVDAADALIEALNKPKVTVK